MAVIEKIAKELHMKPDELLKESIKSNFFDMSMSTASQRVILNQKMG